MTTDNSKEFKDKYFSGNASLEEEKWLKENEADDFFATLQDAQKEKMDWEFADFLETVQTEKAPVIPIAGRTFKMYWAAAAVVILATCGILAFFHGSNEQHNFVQKNIVPVTDSSRQYAVVPKTVQGTTIAATNNIIKKKKTIVPTHYKQYFAAQKNHTVPQQNTIANGNPDVSGTDSSYHANYVLVNGKPIYDEAKAQEIAIQAVNILKDNVRKGVNDLASIKQIPSNIKTILP